MFKIVAVSLHTDDLILIQNIDGPVDPDSQRVTRFRFVLQTSEYLDDVLLRHGFDQILYGVNGKSVNSVFPAARDKRDRCLRTQRFHLFGDFYAVFAFHINIAEQKIVDRSVFDFFQQIFPSVNRSTR